MKSSAIMSLLPKSLTRLILRSLRRPIEDAAAEQAGRKLDHDAGAFSPVVEERVELDQVERGDKPAVAQHFHDQMRLAHRGAAGHRGADAGRDVWIEEIDVETDMQHA